MHVPNSPLPPGYHSNQRNGSGSANRNTLAKALPPEKLSFLPCDTAICYGPTIHVSGGRTKHGTQNLTTSLHIPNVCLLHATPVCRRMLLSSWAQAGHLAFGFGSGSLCRAVCSLFCSNPSLCPCFEFMLTVALTLATLLRVWDA